MRKWNPSRTLLLKIIKDYNGSPYKVAKELGVKVEDLRKYLFLWPNDLLRNYFIRKEKRDLLNKEKEKENKRVKQAAYALRVKLDQEKKDKLLIEVFNKHNGDRKKIQKELKKSRSQVQLLAKKLFYKYPTLFKYFNYKRGIDPDYKIFATNRERLRYLDERQ